ncbi:hypothetical protein ACIQMZ_37225 [Streptomyces longwoodensis]|uniref:hypothetical protein n=1 Tax=Streptomyces longwoodensis TaxID=68231 RepID=UPI003810C493
MDDTEETSDPKYRQVRLPYATHQRLARLADGLSASTGKRVTLGDALEWLLSPNMVRLTLHPDQHARWKAAAKANGCDLHNFISDRVDAAIRNGADPGTLRRIHDMTYALVRAAGIVPQQTPGTDQQIITDHPEGTRHG